MKSAFEKFEAKRDLKIGKYLLRNVFSGLENCEILQKIFGKENLEKILNTTVVRITKQPWIIWVDDKNKMIVINVDYLKNTEKKVLYLDIVHELVHFKQLLNGLNLFDRKYGYAERPTEIEAYKYTVEEARRIGLTKKEIIDYLDVEWISDEEHKRLVDAVMK